MATPIRAIVAGSRSLGAGLEHVGRHSIDPAALPGNVENSTVVDDHMQREFLEMLCR